MTVVLPFRSMRPGNKRLTIDVPEDVHEAFKRYCFLKKPRVDMKDVMVAFICKTVGMPVPEDVDRRKLPKSDRPPESSR